MIPAPSSNPPTEIEIETPETPETPTYSASDLVLAAWNGEYPRVETMLETLNVNQLELLSFDEWEAIGTPLFFAAQEGHEDVVQLLLDNNASTHIDAMLVYKDGDKEIYGPLLAAAARGHSEIVRILLENGADPNPFAHTLAPDGKRVAYPALYTAASENHLEVVQLLLEYHADMTLNYISKNSDGTRETFSPIDVAEDGIRDLLENYEPPEEPEEEAEMEDEEIAEVDDQVEEA